MAKPFTFGIIGASGATGEVVVSTLHKSAAGDLLVGSRDLVTAQALAAQFDNRVSASLLDVQDASSLDLFCSRCAVIVNCAGPVSVLQDRVAQAAWRNRCHYVDPAGLTIVEERMSPHSQAIADAGLSFVISAGWMPGLTELLPAYAHARAKATMDSVESVTVYFADGGDWSRNALLDGVWFLRRRGVSSPMYFRHGKPARAKRALAMRTVDLRGSIGSGRFGLHWTPEMEAVGRCLADCDVFSYSFVSGFRTIAASLLMAAVPLPENIAVGMLRGVFERNRFAAGGFAVGEVRGQLGGGSLHSTTSITFERGQEYWLHGTTLATVAHLIAEDKHVRPGLYFLADAVEPASFMAQLKSAGINVSVGTVGVVSVTKPR